MVGSGPPTPLPTQLVPSPPVLVKERSYIARLITSAIVHPGLTSAQAELMTMKGGMGTPDECEVYTCKVSEFRGLAARTIGEARLRFSGKSVLCGIMATGEDGVESDDDVWVTPSNDYVLAPTDRLVFVAREKGAIRLNAKPRAVVVAPPVESTTTAAAAAAEHVASTSVDGAVSAKGRAAARRRVLVLNWDPKSKDLLKDVAVCWGGSCGIVTKCARRFAQKQRNRSRLGQHRSQHQRSLASPPSLVPNRAGAAKVAKGAKAIRFAHHTYLLEIASSGTSAGTSMKS